jgi:Secretion system C-terminal sorting domain/Pregnancy-associated plasma protein-A
VHEIGHYFNLLHIWGSDTTCVDDDEVDDTPRQASPNDGCPTDLVKSCSNSLDYFRNYMDYTNDDCMSFFTNGQKTRMWATLNGFRAGLMNNNLCDPVAVNDIKKPTFEVYPNPAHDVLKVAIKNWNSGRSKRIKLFDTLGHIVIEKVVDTEGVVDLPIDGLANGFYFITLTIDNQNFTKKIIIQN